MRSNQDIVITPEDRERFYIWYTNGCVRLYEYIYSIKEKMTRQIILAIGIILVILGGFWPEITAYLAALV